MGRKKKSDKNLSGVGGTGVDQNVRENGNRVLTFDDPLKELKFAKQVGLSNDKFHGSASSHGVAGRE